MRFVSIALVLSALHTFSALNKLKPFVSTETSNTYLSFRLKLGLEKPMTILPFLNGLIEIHDL